MKLPPNIHLSRAWSANFKMVCMSSEAEGQLSHQINDCLGAISFEKAFSFATFEPFFTTRVSSRIAI
jgi:hypothetical protein